MANNAQELDFQGLVEWFDGYQSSDFKEFAAEAKKLDFLSPRDRKFLYDMSSFAGRRSTPSEKQLRYLKSIVDTLESRDESSAIESPSTSPLKRDSMMESPKHLTIRLAWHDSMWNGRICADPIQNHYCTGEHSLLSSRLRERKQPILEASFRSQPLDQAGVRPYLPPCFWSINANSDRAALIEHDNPAMPNFPHISERLPAYSVFTWPFRLSFNKDGYESDGKYPANLESRIQGFLKRVKRKTSIAFLYCNWDNPISADDQKYLIVGCALIQDIGKPTYFNVSDAELAQIRRKRGMANFPTMNWALRVTLDLPNAGFFLPYQVYLSELTRTDDFTRLDEAKVIVSEAELEQDFKYVASHVDDDTCLFLLSKLKKSILIMQEHGIAPKDSLAQYKSIVDSLLESTWSNRGLFPGWSELTNSLLEPDSRQSAGLEGLPQNLNAKNTLRKLEEISALINEPATATGELAQYARPLRRLKRRLEERGIECSDIAKLASISLTRKQFDRIMSGKGIPGGRISNISSNPYLLYERYLPGQEDADINTGEIVDKPIDLYRLDIALFPDDRYSDFDSCFPSIRIDGPQRLRALAIDYLRSLENRGDCYCLAKDLLAYSVTRPLFYERSLHVSQEAFDKPSVSAKQHFSESLKVDSSDDKETTYALLDIWQFERNVENLLRSRLEAPDLRDQDCTEFEKIVRLSKAILEKKHIADFNSDDYERQHLHLYSNVMRKRFFVISGSPGTGKSQALLQLASVLKTKKESVLILAPTGKAVQRLVTDKLVTGVKIETIDKFLVQLLRSGGKAIVDNLIIDEMSMVTIDKFHQLLDAFGNSADQLKRLVLVGDPYQLPPIGFGKVFVDIISYLKSNKLSENYCDLAVNCRQQSDSRIVELVRAIGGQHRMREVTLATLKSAGKKSDHLYVSHWRSSTELENALEERFNDLFAEGHDDTVRMDAALGLSPNAASVEDMSIINPEKFQIISPYRSGYSGVVGVNGLFQQKYRGSMLFAQVHNSAFRIGDKLINVVNQYDQTNRNQLILSNGSIGTLIKHHNRAYVCFNSELKFDLYDNALRELELAYAITIHKAQGSGFDHTFVIIPKKPALLCKELLYTAFSRSQVSLSLFLYAEDAFLEQLLSNYSKKSHSESRRTSVFATSHDEAVQKYIPIPNIVVKSRAEYIIHKKCEEFAAATAGCDFAYEAPLQLTYHDFTIRPDFTLTTPEGNTYFWEHLGMLGDPRYVSDWERRKLVYEREGLLERVVTTDDLNGIDDAKLSGVLTDVLSGNLRQSQSTWSRHHYPL